MDFLRNLLKVSGVIPSMEAIKFNGTWLNSSLLIIHKQQSGLIVSVCLKSLAHLGLAQYICCYLSP